MAIDEWCRLLHSQDVPRNGHAVQTVDGRTFRVNRTGSGKLRCTEIGGVAIPLKEDGVYISLNMAEDASSRGVIGRDGGADGNGRGSSLENKDDQVSKTRSAPSSRGPSASSSRGLSAVSSRAASASSTRPHTPASRLQSRANSAAHSSHVGDERVEQTRRRPPLAALSSNRLSGSRERPQSGMHHSADRLFASKSTSSHTGRPFSAMELDTPSKTAKHNRPSSAMGLVSPSKKRQGSASSKVSHVGGHSQTDGRRQRGLRPSSAMSAVLPFDQFRVRGAHDSTLQIRDLGGSDLDTPASKRKVSSATMGTRDMRVSAEVKRSRSAGSFRLPSAQPGIAGRVGSGLGRVKEEHSYNEDDDARLYYDEDTEESVDGDEEGYRDENGRADYEYEHEHEHERDKEESSGRDRQRIGGDTGLEVRGLSDEAGKRKSALRPGTSLGVRRPNSAVSWGHIEAPNRAQSAERGAQNLLARSGERGGAEGAGKHASSDAVARGGQNKEESRRLRSKLNRPSTALIESFQPAEEEDEDGAGGTHGTPLRTRTPSAIRRASSAGTPLSRSGSASAIRGTEAADPVKLLEAEVKATKAAFGEMVVQESKKVWDIGNRVQKIQDKLIVAQSQLNSTLLYIQSTEDEIGEVDQRLQELDKKHHDAKLRASSVSKSVEERKAEGKKASTMLQQEFSEVKREASNAAAEMKAEEQKRSKLESKVAATRKKADIMKMGVDSLTNKAAKMTRNRQALKQELARAKTCIDQDDFNFDISSLPEHLGQVFDEIKGKVRHLIKLKAKDMTEEEQYGSSDGDQEEEEQEDVEKPEGWGEKEDGEGWKNSATVLRKAMLAARAPSPRWAQKEFQQMTSWAADVKRTWDMKNSEKEAREAEERKKEGANEQVGAGGVEKEKGPVEDDSQRFRQKRRPATVELWSETSAANYEKSYFDTLSMQVADRWREEFMERISLEQSRADAGRDTKQMWRERGLPVDEESDIKKLRGVQSDQMQPPVEGLMELFKSRLKAKCKDFSLLFSSMDGDKDGLIDIQGFMDGVSPFDLGFSSFEVARVFGFASDNRGVVSYEELMIFFAPPVPSRPNIERMNRTFPFLLKDESETDVKLLLSRMSRMSFKAGECVYAVGRMEDWMWIVESGTVEVTDCKGLVEMVTRDSAFGIAQALTRPNSDASFRRDTVHAATDCVLWKLTKVDLDYVISKKDGLKRDFYGLDDFCAASFRASLSATQSFAPIGTLSGKANVNERGRNHVSLGSSPAYVVDGASVVSTMQRQLRGKWGQKREDQGGWDSLFCKTRLPMGSHEILEKKEPPNGECARLANDRVVDYTCSLVPRLRERLKFAKKAFDARIHRTNALNWKCRQAIASIS